MAEDKKEKSETTPVPAKAADTQEIQQGPVATEVEGKKRKRRSKKKALTDGRIYVHATYNNTIVTITDSQGNPALWASAGNCGFKGTRKSTPYAAQMTSEKAMEKAKLLGFERAHVFVKGTGIGRDQALRALAASGVDLLTITDLTSLPHGGCRPRKPRRV